MTQSNGPIAADIAESEFRISVQESIPTLCLDQTNGCTLKTPTRMDISGKQCREYCYSIVLHASTIGLQKPLNSSRIRNNVEDLAPYKTLQNDAMSSSMAGMGRNLLAFMLHG